MGPPALFGPYFIYSLSVPRVSATDSYNNSIAICSGSELIFYKQTTTNWIPALIDILLLIFILMHIFSYLLYFASY